MKKKYQTGIAFLLLLLSSCNKDDNTNIKPAALCDSSNTTFNQLYSNIVSTINYANFDSAGIGEIHSYDFEVTSTKTICKIGYQSQSLINGTQYLIEIFNNTSNTLVYSGSHIFSDTSTSYVSITPLTLNVGDLYTIKRIQTNWNGIIENKTGRAVGNAIGTFNFPIIMDDLKITNPKFYDVGSSQFSNFALPYIDIVFEN